MTTGANRPPEFAFPALTRNVRLSARLRSVGLVGANCLRPKIAELNLGGGEVPGVMHFVDMDIG